MSFKIALTAGHYKNTAGKRCLKSLDPNETREWVLNDRIADKVEKLLQNYTGYELIRTDDTTGNKDISLTARTNAANNFGADFYLSIHHNAGINGGSGGGIVIYIHNNASAASAEWQKDLYAALIEATGLKGNRSSPLARANFHEVRETNMPAVLLELGFMDSKTDVPVILTEKFADQCADAIVKVLVKRGKLTKKVPVKSMVTVTLPQSVKGDKGEAVKALQILLEGRGYPCGNGATGTFGSGTESAVKTYQKEKGLPANGVVDAKTWASLLGV